MCSFQFKLQTCAKMMDCDPKPDPRNLMGCQLWDSRFRPDNQSGRYSPDRILYCTSNGNFRELDVCGSNLVSRNHHCSRNAESVSACWNGIGLVAYISEGMAYLSVWESEEYSRVKLPGKALQVSVHTFGIMYRCNSGEVFMNTWDQIKTPGTPEDPRKISPGDVLIRYMTAGTTSGLMVTDKGKLLLAFSRIGSQSEFPETVAEIDVPYGFKVRYVNACYNGIILNDSLDKFLFMNGRDGFRQYLKCDGMSRVREEPVIIPLPQSFSQYDPVIDITPFGPYWLILNSN